MILIIRSRSATTILDLSKATQINVSRRYIRVCFENNSVAFQFLRELKDVEQIATHLAAAKNHPKLVVELDRLLEGVRQ